MDVEAKRKSARKSMARFRAANPIYYKAYKQRYRKRQRALGYCSSCLCRQPQPGFKSCTECRQGHRDFNKRYAERRRMLSIKRRYGLDEEAYTRLLIVQKHACLICRRLLVRDKFSIDHDHHTGKVRGILCNLCNIGLGSFQDNPKSLRRAARYVAAQA